MDDTYKFLEYLTDPKVWQKHMGMGFIENPKSDFQSARIKPEMIEKVEYDRPKGSMLPTFIRGTDFPPRYELEKRPPLVEGLFRAKDNVLLGAPPKMGKTWFFSTLALSMSEGRKFLGMETRQSKVLIIDLELHRDDCLDRLYAIADANEFKGMPRDLWVWCLREYEYDLDLLITEMDEQIDKMGGVDVIILDPIYMLGHQDFDENNAQSVKHFLKAISQLKLKNNSALLLSHHFSKGNKGREGHSDRISGSGTFQRWPDSLITITPHAIAKHGVLEVTGRSMPKFEPMVINMTPPCIHATSLAVEF